MGLHHKSLAWLHVFLKECLQKECFHELNEHRWILITLFWLSEKESHVMNDVD